MASRRPAFLITIDTEGDDLWHARGQITTHNARYLPRFQRLAERYGLKPTWLTDYEMVQSRPFCQFARDALARGTAEVGMHLHAWNTPPLVPLTADDRQYCPYLIEYPHSAMRDKIALLTNRLADEFGRPPVSHRAGRWAMDKTYAALLAQAGYRVDCSVTPHVDWSRFAGAPEGRGGTDYRGFPAHAYWMDHEHIDRSGAGPLLEVPLSVELTRYAHLERLWARSPRIVGRTGRRLLPPLRWLRPDGRNLRAMVSLVQRAASEGRAHVEFMLHSSELMPGGSPAFRTAASIERLYGNLEMLFAEAGARCTGMTLREFYDERAAMRPGMRPPHSHPARVQEA